LVGASKGHYLRGCERVQEGSEGLNLEQALGVLRRRTPLILLCVVVVAGVAFAVSRHESKKYTTTASLSFSNNQLSEQVAGLPAINSGNQLSQQASDVQDVTLGDIAAKTASQLGHGLTATKVTQSLSIAGQGESTVVDVAATSSSPVLAAEIANTYAHAYVAEQQASNHRYFQSALALVNKQLAALSSKQRVGADGVALQDRAESLGLLAELDYGDAQVAQEAAVPASASSPKTSRNVVLGGFLGLVLGLGLAFLLERLDRRIRRPDELEAKYGLPILGAVPKSSALSRAARGEKGPRASLPPAVAEAFRLIRAHVRFLDADRNVRTILIASAASGDGRTTVARHLAEAAARMGSRVLLLEADLRHPTLSRQLGLQYALGLTDVAIGAASIDEATQSIDLDVSDDATTEDRTLDVMTAGSGLPLNPGQLMETPSMAALLDRLRSAYDLVVIDTPPLAAVSDAFPLLAKADGVIVVSRIAHSRHDVAERLRRILDSSGASLLGLIANGAKSIGSGSYTYTRSDKPALASGSVNGVPSSETSVPAVKA
jgi:polysaccharide biosynthesis transport protein